MHQRPVAPLFPKASLGGITESEACRLSWVLSGLTVQADWTGSNPEWFPPQQAGTPVASYWHQALSRADTAISEAELHRARPMPNGAAHVLTHAALPRPMQAAVADIDLPDGPVMSLVARIGMETEFPLSPSGSVRRCVRTQAVRARSLCSGLFGRVGSP